MSAWLQPTHFPVAGRIRVRTRAMRNALVSFWSQGETARVAYVVGVLLLVSGLIHSTIIVATGASLSGPLSLRKPATFGLSFGLTAMTIAWVASFLRLGDRTRTIL